MKSNMSFLRKILIFSLVFSTVSNFVTSDAVKDCIENVKIVFLDSVLSGFYNRPENDFKLAMAAFSKNLLTSSFLLDYATNLSRFYKQFEDMISTIGDDTFISKHSEVLKYFEQKKMEMKHKNERSIARKRESVMGYAKSDNTNESTFATKKKHIRGYIKSLVIKFDNPNYPSISKWISDNTVSPRGFCEHRKYYGLSEIDIDTCNKALCTMLKLKDDDESTQMEKFMNMTESKAFKYCYLNYTYLDFTTSNLSSQGGSSSSSSVSSNVVPNESSIMIKYFSYLLNVSTQISRNSELIDPELFPSIGEYCATAVNS